MLRGAILGYGKIAQTGHVPAYLNPKLQPDIRIVAVAEPNLTYRQQAEESFDGVHTYESISKLIAAESLDFVDICTPPHTHGQIVKLCAEKGFHILCEKPFVRELDEAREVAALLVKRPDLVFMPCHQYRYSPVWRPFKELVETAPSASSNLLQFLVCRMQADPGYLADNPNWRTERQLSGGGILADTGVHYLYLVRWILGAPRRVTAHTLNLHHREMKVEDTAVAVIECERGIAEITLTWAADRRANSARLANHNCSLVYNGMQLERATQSGVELLPVPDASDKSQYVRLYIALIDEFAGRIRNRQPDLGWIDEARESIELLHACYQSAAEHRSVTLAHREAPPFLPR